MAVGILERLVMVINNAGLRVDGNYNPNWKGGLIKKICQICSSY